jgi:hypothetical protein
MSAGLGKTAGFVQALSVEALSTTLVLLGSRLKNPRFFFAWHRLAQSMRFAPFFVAMTKKVREAIQKV